MKNLKRVYLSIGSNLGDRLQQLQQAVYNIREMVGVVVKISPVYQTPAFGFNAPYFYNACLLIETSLNSSELLQKILIIEKAMGRTRNQETNYQSRTIDIDVLFVDDEIINQDNLQIPHPEIQNRLFVLKPLSDIAPSKIHPKLHKTITQLLDECDDRSELQKIPATLNATEQHKPFSYKYIAIEGNIGAGKTSLSKKIASDFNGKLVLERFADNPFLPKFYEDKNRYAFPLEMSFLADRYQQISDDLSQFDLFKDFIVSDYDVYKSLIFAGVTLTDEEYKLYRKLFTIMYQNLVKPDLYTYLYQNTERLLKNIKKRGRGYEQNISSDYLEKINKGYLDFIKTQKDVNTLIIDVSEKDFVNNRNDYEEILQQITHHDS